MIRIAWREPAPRARLDGVEATPVVVHRGDREATGACRDGESWAAAADRVAAGLGEVGGTVAHDLSGPTKVFEADPELRVATRPMTAGDLPDLRRWLLAEHVQRWWHARSVTTESVRTTYLPRIEGGEPVRMWVVEANGRSVGFGQDYRIADHPQFALLAPDPEAIGIDYAVGEPAWLGRGLGVRLLWAWLTGLRDHYPGATACFAAPDHRNTASLRVLGKVGFEQGTWFDEPVRGGGVSTVVGCTSQVCRVLG